jgi:hypothetical protein
VLQTRVREVMILPDHRFFMRSVALTDEAEAGPVADQVELALEGMAPFPLSQTLWGYWTKPGGDRALVFATYQKRFTAEEMADWADAEWVTPALEHLVGRTGARAGDNFYPDGRGFHDGGPFWR